MRLDDQTAREYAETHIESWAREAADDVLGMAETTDLDDEQIEQVMNLISSAHISVEWD